MDAEFKEMLEKMNETMRQVSESLGVHTEVIRKSTEDLEKNTKTVREDQRKAGDLRKQEIKQTQERLGYYKDEMGVMRESIDLRKVQQKAERDAVENIKKQVGEEAFLRKQQQRFLNDEIEKLQTSTNAYGGAVKSVMDLTDAQKQQYINARKVAEADEERAKNAAKATEALVKPGREMTNYTNQFGKKIESISDITGFASDSLFKFAEGSKLGTAAVTGLQMAAQLTIAALTGAAKASLTMGKSLLAGERGMAVGAKGVSAFTAEMAKATKMVGTALTGLGAGIIGVSVLLAPFTGGISLAGVALGGLAVAAGVTAEVVSSTAETLAELNMIAAETNDKLFSGFKEIAKMSMTGARGMEGLAEDMHKMGLTVAEFDKFRSVISANAREMKMFGATAVQGVNLFAETSGKLLKSEMGKSLELMGIGAEEQYEHTAKYMALQSRLGLMQEKNADKLAKKTNEYIIELDKIAAITGATRKEQEDARNAVMAIEQLRAGMLVEQEKAERGDPEAKARLQEMERALAVATTLQAKGAVREAKGAAEFYGAGKAITSQESAEFARMAGGRGGTIEQINKGIGTDATRSQAALNEMVRSATQAAAVGRYGGDTKGLFGGSFKAAGDIKAEQAAFNEARIKAEKEATAKGVKFDEQKFADDFAKQALAERQARDSSTQQNVDITRQQRDTAITMEKAVIEYNRSVGINAAASKMFADAVKKFDEFFNGKKTSGASGATLAKPNFADAAGTSDASAILNANGEKTPEQIRAENAQRQKDLKDAPWYTRWYGIGEEKYRQQNNLLPKGVAPSSAGGGRGSVSPPPVGKIQTSEEQLAEAGLKLKKGDVHREGAQLDPRIIEIAKQVQAQVPNFVQFTGFNDQYHQERAPGSKHVDGLAFDFVVGRKPSREEGQAITKMLRDLGADYALDEYNNASAKSTGGHFHAHLTAYDGGVFDGPTSGYNVELHGREAIIPLPDPGKALAEEPSIAATKSPLSDLVKEQTAGSGGSNNDIVAEMMVELMGTLTSKMDEMIDKLGEGNDISDKLLRVSRV